jgi:hypothetical protein
LEEIEELEEQTRHIGTIENMYKLTPMQKGMLFHSLLEPHSEVYFEQAKFEIQGAFYPEDFKHSLKRLMKRHAILRTNFHVGWGDFPIQIVFKERACDFVYEDLHELESGEIEARLAAYIAQDKARGFDLANEALLRVAILRTAEEAYHMLWSSHHINTVPVRIQAEGSDTFSDVMKRQQELYLAGHAYDSYPLYEIQAQSEQKQDLISHIMVFENYPVEEHLEEKIASEEAEYKITDVQMFEQTNYDFNLIVLPGRNLEFLYRYNARVYDRESVERIQGHLTRILTNVSVQPAIRIDELELITPDEKSQIIEVWGDTAALYPREKTLHGIFEEKAALTPDRTALIYGETKLTYEEPHR